MALISKKNLDFWIQNNLNVLLIGHAGVGKTHIVLEAFKRHNLTCQYYSCSTLDPYVDFIGVPREVDDPESNTKVLDLVRPKQWARDEIEVLFLDEYNRSKMAVRNAVMELIQFRSINGKKFNKLRMVWAAINPDESEEQINYDVEPLDPAQKDRFHVHFEVPYQPDMEYMESKFGKTSAKLAIEWWRSLDKSAKPLVSPRRLEYAVNVHNLGGDISFVIPKIANPIALQKRLGSISVVEKINGFMEPTFVDTNAIKEFFEVETNYHYGIGTIMDNQKMWSKLLPCMPLEKLNAMLATKGNEKVISYIINNSGVFSSLFEDVAKMPNDSSLRKLVCANVLRTPNAPETLKEQLGLNKKGVKFTEPATPVQEEFIDNVIKQMNGWVATAAKNKFVKDYVCTFCKSKDTTIARDEALLKREADMLFAVANRMHSYSFAKLLETEVYIPIVGRMKLKTYFKQNDSALKADNRYHTFSGHLRPIFDSK